MSTLENREGPCPECGSDWQGEKIPVADLLSGCYGEWRLGDPYRYFGRLIGVELSHAHPQHYDGVSYWMCPDCRATWNRFTNERETIPPFDEAA